jgi:hypothetical protein
MRIPETIPGRSRRRREGLIAKVSKVWSFGVMLCEGPILKKPEVLK